MGSNAPEAPISHGVRRPNRDLVRSDSDPPNGLNSVAKIALTPATRPSAATLCARSICSS
jgi:hypothetical protein